MRMHKKAALLLMLVLAAASQMALAAAPQTKSLAAAGSSSNLDKSLKTGAVKDDPAKLLQAYRANLDLLRREHGGTRDMPDVRFFLFGMGPRRKMIYMEGALKDALSGEIIKRWDVAAETIVPSMYAIFVKTKNGRSVNITEDETGVWLADGGRKTSLSESRINLPTFAGHKYAPVLRVLHQEILVNVINAQPGIPNYFVYSKPWYRDGAMMCMVLKETGNMDLVRNWILGLRDPFDRNNGGEAEADNLGQVLYMISLVSDKSHPLVKTILEMLPKYHEGKHIKGRSDFAEHPVYQTKWLKHGLAGLKLNDPYEIPEVKDSYSPLFWWAYKDKHVKNERFSNENGQLYPYLVWAEDNFYGERRGAISNRDYPLSWETKASQANYNGMLALSQAYVDQKTSAPHTWHAAEMFLSLLKK